MRFPARYNNIQPDTANVKCQTKLCLHLQIVKWVQETTAYEASLSLRGQYWPLEAAFYHEIDLGL